MRSEKGITLTSLIIYVIVVLVVIGMLSVISMTFQGNIKEIYAEGTNNAEIDKFNVYFLKEVKKQENGISSLSDDEVLFISENKYTYNNEEQCIYLNDNIKIAENIEECKFEDTDLDNGKTVITVTIKALNSEEKSIEYVLNNEIIEDNSDNESNYTNYIPKKWDISKLNKKNPIIWEKIDGNLYTAPIPNGFEVSAKETENKISLGLVITDGSNEFVWVPVKGAANYQEESFGPLTGTNGTSGKVYDSQEELDFYYGTGYYYKKDFTYAEDKTKIENSIKKYGGFYVGRYETTIDGSIIGVEKGKTVLTSIDVLKTGSNTAGSGDYYHYRWWGLYSVQKMMYAKNETVGSLMISSKQWDAIMEWTGYGNTKRKSDTYTNTNSPDLSGTAYKNTTDTYDLVKNIYDLAGNVCEWSLKVNGTSDRVFRGGKFNAEWDSANSNWSSVPSYFNINIGSRVALYIK